MKAAVVPASIVLLAVLTACGERRPAVSPFAAAESTAVELERLRPGLGRTAYRVVEGDNQSDVAAYTSGPANVVLVEEMRLLGGFGSVRAGYYLSNGKLVYYREEGLRGRDTPSGPVVDSIARRFAFDTAGHIVATEALINGKAQPIDTAAVRGVQHHLRTLLDSFPRLP
ncbi:MAG: hypothetical protein ACOY71_00865 [Gemmatimonadota bacterium]